MNIAVIKGDGIGPEIVNQALDVLVRAGEKFGFECKFTDVLMGGCAIDQTGVPLPEETLSVCMQSDAVLLGAVGGAKWDSLPGHLRPEAGLLGLRGALGLFANIRPVKLFSALSSASPLKLSTAETPLDLVIVRELTGGAYFGKRSTSTDSKGIKTATDSMTYSDFEIERLVRAGFELAMKRRKKLHSVDKANVLDSSRLWREIAHKVKSGYPDVEYQDMLVDNCAMQLIRNPMQFDVIVTENLFGDILSDEASMLTGSLGMLPSASLGGGSLGLYEPIHGSAPDIAGKDIANPIAMILSVSMMLDHSLAAAAQEGRKFKDAALAIENAVLSVLNDGYRTADLTADGVSAEKNVSCSEMGQLIKERL
ncbi:MAG: 3-isopropylmalate dehydrogenase [Oscillospiraceae bacterium]|nr:3-isopropylmalate dehydrogenase [Oscillospiraceae bacterium]